MISPSTLADRRGLWAFIVGVIAVTGGVLMHAPMYLMGRHNHYVLYGMPIGWDMVAGMAAIIGGLALAAYGLLPRNLPRQLRPRRKFRSRHPRTRRSPRALDLDVGAGRRAHHRHYEACKPRFTIPGMMAEYHDKATVSLLPFTALTGLSWVRSSGRDCGRLWTQASSSCFRCNVRRTSICGAMPSLAWNVAMFFMMGAAAGGMLPVT